jgi:tetratricopeptide (TPR) repeat protein
MGDGTEKYKDSVGRFVVLLGEGVGETEALRDAFGEVESLERDLRRYVRQPRFFFAKVPFRPQAHEIAVRPLPAELSAALRAVFLVRTGRPREAAKLVDEALSIAPGLAMAHEAKGHLLLHEGKFEEARRSFDEAARLKPNSYLAHFYGARASRTPGDDAERRERGLRRAMELQPGFAPAYIELAELILARGENLEEGLALARRAVRLRPYDSSYQLTLMRMLQETERSQEAAEVEAGLVRAAHSDPSAHAALLAFYRSSDRWQDVERLLRRAVEQNPTASRAITSLVGFLKDQERPDEAEAVLRAGLKNQPDSPALLNSLSYLYAERGVRLQEALSLIGKALRSEPERSSYLDTKGWVLFRLKRHAEAEKCLRKALSQWESPTYMDHLGDVLEARGALAEAVECWKKALDHRFGSDQLKAALREKIQAAEAELGTSGQSELPSPELLPLEAPSA